MWWDIGLTHTHPFRTYLWKLERFFKEPKLATCIDDKEYFMCNCCTIIPANNSWVERWLYKGHWRKVLYSVFSEWVTFIFFFILKITRKKRTEKFSLRIFPKASKFLVPRMSIRYKIVDWFIDFDSSTIFKQVSRSFVSSRIMIQIVVNLNPKPILEIITP